MTTELSQFDQALKEYKPDFYANLKPGTSEQAWYDLETDLFPKAAEHVVFPTDLKDLYLWKNGSPQTFLGEYVWLSVEEIRQAVKDLWAYNKDIIAQYGQCNLLWWPKWIPMFQSGADYICYDMVGSFDGTPGQIIQLLHDSESRTFFAPNLATFLAGISQSIEQNSNGDLFEIFLKIMPEVELQYPKFDVQTKGNLSGKKPKK
jgi:cell wall assembly regulator SMI1